MERGFLGMKAGNR